jgi:alpha-beta hydrolase superfamily lysophospholipase
VASGPRHPLGWLLVVLLLPVGLLAPPVVLGALPVAVTAGSHDRSARDVPFATGTGPGSVVSARTMPGLVWALRSLRPHAARIEYRSTDRASHPTLVSGSVFTPRGDPPEGGWRVVGLGHGSTGISRSCAPSLAPDLRGSAVFVAAYLRAGYAVALPDYQGLGAPGAHPYLDSGVAGRNLVDAVRALRSVYDDASTRWVAAGISQGGGAAWAANELAASYAPELDLVGSVSVSPAADMSGLVVKAERGTLPPGQSAILQWVLEGLHRTDPDFDLDLYRSGAVVPAWAVLSQCGGDDVARRAATIQRIGPFDLRPHTAAAAADLTTRLSRMAVPQQRASAPMLVVYGAADPFVDPAWTTAAIVRARALGDDVTADLQPGRGHLDVDGSAVNPWIAARFADG